jgi:N-acetylglutamate synthase-like GNAT family acetyltransferase
VSAAAVRRLAASSLVAKPLKTGELGAMAKGLAKAGLPVDDIDLPGRYFWRFETTELVPLGYGGLEPYGPDVLLRSVLTLPPARRRGVGAAIVAALESEAQVLKGRTVWLITTDAQDFFTRLGYAAVARDEAPPAIRATRQFSSLCPDTAAVMRKRLD